MSEISVVTGVDGKQYKVSNGTWYHADTLDEVIAVLEEFRAKYKRIRVTYGKIVEDKVVEDHKMLGYVGRSMGPVKVPLIVFNDRCYGGHEIWSHEIVKIELSKKQGCEKVIWSYPAYQTEEQGVM